MSADDTQQAATDVEKSCPSAQDNTKVVSICQHTGSRSAGPTGRVRASYNRKTSLLRFWTRSRGDWNVASGSEGMRHGVVEGRP